MRFPLDFRGPLARADLLFRDIGHDLIVPDRRAAAIARETDFHSWIYEVSGHSFLQSHWQRLVPLVRIYFSLYHRMHGAQGEFGRMTTAYLKIATGGTLKQMQAHIAEHMMQGLEVVIAAVPEG